MGDGVRVRLAVETTVTTTMERRKFVIGAGALATGSAAAVGSGAFTSVQADRDVEVDVAGDADAFLSLGPSGDPNGEYVDDGGDVIGLDFTDSDKGGDGINDEAYTIFESVLEVQNQGTQSVKVGARDIDAGPAEFQVFLSRENLDYENGSPSEGAQGMRLDQSADIEDLPEIDAGEGITVGFAFNLGKNADFDDIDDTMELVASTEDRFPE